MKMRHFQPEDFRDDIDLITVTLRIPSTPEALLLAFNSIDSLGEQMVDVAFRANGGTEDDDILQFVSSMPKPWQEAIHSLKVAFKALKAISMDTLTTDVDPSSLAGKIISIFSDLENQEITTEEVSEKLYEAFKDIDVQEVELTEEQAAQLDDVINNGLRDPEVLSDLSAVLTASQIVKDQD